MTRVVSLFLPRWPTDRLRRKSPDAASLRDRPLVLVGHEGARRVVTALDAAAEHLGLRVGMPVAKAQALAPGLVLRPADLQADAKGLELLARWALQHISPVVAADLPDGLVIDTTGAEHLHGGETAMLAFLVERLAGAGIEARAAIADTWGAAHAAARFLRPAINIIASGETRAMLRPLPVAALRLEPALVAALRPLGLTRIADLVDRPRAPLALRFGPGPGRRLDQALGLVAEPIKPLRLPEVVEAHRNFVEPIAAPETIARYVGKLAVTLCASLERCGLGLRRVDLRIRRIDNSFQVCRVGTARPMRDAARLTRLLGEKIETLDPGFGIETMTLAAIMAEPLVARQTVSALGEEAGPDLSDLIDKLANRVGEDRLYRFTPVESEVPERSVRRVAALAHDTGATWRQDWPRPPRLLPRPEPIEIMALLPDHPPAWFRWRGLRRIVRRADGPERIHGEWWRRDAELAAVRDYFRVEDEAGKRYWIFRAGDGETVQSGSQNWFLHGIFA